MRRFPANRDEPPAPAKNRRLSESVMRAGSGSGLGRVERPDVAVNKDRLPEPNRPMLRAIANGSSLAGRQAHEATGDVVRDDPAAGNHEEKPRQAARAAARAATPRARRRWPCRWPATSPPAPEPDRRAQRKPPAPKRQKKSRAIEEPPKVLWLSREGDLSIRRPEVRWRAFVITRPSATAPWRVHHPLRLTPCRSPARACAQIRKCRKTLHLAGRPSSISRI